VIKLDERDLRALLDLVGEAYHAADLAEFRAVVVPAAKRVVPADIVSYNEVAGEGRVIAAFTHPVLPEEFFAVWSEYAHENPLYRRYARTRDARPYRFSDVLPHEQLVALGLFRHLYGPLGVVHQVAFALPSGPTMSVAMALMRGPGADFSARDVRLLDLARPHLAQAYRNAALAEQTRGVVAALLGGIEDAGDAVAVVDPRGRVVAAGPSARRHLAELAGAKVADGDALPEVLRAWWATTDPARLPLTLHPRADRDERLLTRRLRGPRGDGYDLLLFERHGRSVPRDVLRSLGLTAQEAAVLDGFLRGGSTATVATAVGVRPRTVDKHAQAIHRKLGVRSRTEAIAAAWNAAGLADQVVVSSPAASVT
jgi:DNA-binding CsgD family transcriptional regulator